MHSQLRVVLRPNNQITITKGNWRKKLIESANILGENSPDKYQLARYRHATKVGDHNEYGLETWDAKLDRLFPPLDIIKKSQRSKKAPCMRLNTPKSFTRFSGQKLRESGAAISIACDGKPSRAHEVTLTLPANTVEAFTALAAYSGYVINRLFQPIRRDYGTNCLWFFVWEYQKRGALHMHICIYHESESEGALITQRLIEQWHKILCDLSELAGTCMFTAKQKDRCTIRSKHQHHTSPIKKDVGRYFAKYAGKEESKTEWYCKKYPVSRFWGSSKGVKEIIKAHSMQIDFNLIDNGRDCERAFSELVSDLIEPLDIVSISHYEFKVQARKDASIRSYSNGRKIVSVADGIVWAEGERYTIYFEQSQYLRVMELLGMMNPFG